MRSPRAPSGPRVDSWSQFDGLSAGTKSFIFWTALLGLGALVLSFLFELAFFWLIGSCPTGETLVLKTNRNHVTDPHFLKRWSAIVATDVTRQCVPRWLLLGKRGTRRPLEPSENVGNQAATIRVFEKT